MAGESLNELTYRSLRKDIMMLKLRPGTVLSTAKVAEEYHVSRTPAREAILRLNKAGLVDVFPQSRTCVSRIDLERVNQEWFIRKSLEVSVLDEFMVNCSMRDINELISIVDHQEQCISSGSFISYFNWDNEFHKKIFIVAEQLLAWNMIIDVNCHYNRLRILVMEGNQAQIEAVEEHRRIIQAMQNRDTAMVKRHMLDHMEKIEVQREDILNIYSEYFVLTNKLNSK